MFGTKRPPGVYTEHAAYLCRAASSICFVLQSKHGSFSKHPTLKLSRADRGVETPAIVCPFIYPPFKLAITTINIYISIELYSSCTVFMMNQCVISVESTEGKRIYTCINVPFCIAEPLDQCPWPTRRLGYCYAMSVASTRGLFFPDRQLLQKCGDTPIIIVLGYVCEWSAKSSPLGDPQKACPRPNRPSLRQISQQPLQYTHLTTIFLRWSKTAPHIPYTKIGVLPNKPHTTPSMFSNETCLSYEGFFYESR